VKVHLRTAHKELPLGTQVRVTALKTCNSVDVTVNDRRPYVKGRIIDLSRNGG
jgi:rare lipoprotein A